MHLRSLRLRGFKSFPDELELRLEPGVAVVVGPNGSGKSNVADAIVWAAGSLTPSELRAERPDDVLFGGSATRGPAEHCEVELVFDNEDASFGALDFSEVSIARRLVRGGEGQYLVNRAAVRRLDLVELLADVGLGGSMHSIVSQGKVDAVLASRPRDRRALIEEAAGLGKYKRRKHRAELKLARVGAQVERARDVEEEVRKRLRPLALQATAAERAEKLGVEIASLRARVAQLDLSALAERRARGEQERSDAASSRHDLGTRMDELVAARTRAEDQLSDAAGNREVAVQSLYRLEGASERLGLRRESSEALRARLASELEELEHARAERNDVVLKALEQAALTAAADARDVAQASGAAAERARRAHARLAAFERAAAVSAEATLEELRGRRRAVEGELAQATGGHDGASKALLALGRARERLGVRVEVIGALGNDLSADLVEAQRLARQAGPPPLELERLANEAAAVARSAASERDEVAERARSARERLTAVERAVADRDGIPAAARTLAAAGEQLALSALEVEPGSEQLIAAALASRASALLAPDARSGLDLLERARRDELGNLTVVFEHGKRGDAPPVPGARPLRSLARGSETALALLDGMWLVERDQLLSATHGIVISADGAAFDADRGELWLSGTTAESVLLELEARRRALLDEVNELEARTAAAAKAAEEAAANAEAAEAAFAAVAHLRARILDVALLTALSQCAGATLELAQRAALAATRIEEPLGARLALGTERAGELSHDLRRLSGMEADAARSAADAIARAQAAEVVVARLGGSTEVAHFGEDVTREGLARKAVDLLAEANAKSSEAQAAADRARAAEAALIERTPRASRLDPDLLARLVAVADQLGHTLLAAANGADRIRGPVRARVELGAQSAAQLGEELRRLGAEEVELRGQLDAASERATRIQVELARIGAEEDDARRRLDALGTVTPAEGDERDELNGRAERLESRREALGRVNPLAKEEYEAEKERLDELSRQRADLEESLGELEKLRADLAETVESRFEATFAAVASHFEEVASTLFPGGEGKLQLVADEDAEEGELGVEVELRPAGKKVTRLSLLSGGEKALGAISFLFALFLSKPCPFYLLDEVEAALDDTNVARFVELLRRYSDRAQFIVITHQKRTMEAADILYGVTMGTDGISQIVSRRLPREEHLAATA